jgi:putative oxidoreductase
MNALARLEQPAYALLRIVSGALFALHGTQKLFNFPPSPHPIPQFSQVWFGGVIELVCGVLIAIGLLTRPAAFLASGTMAVAYLQFHWKLQTEGLAWLPSVNQGELAVVYCFLFLFIAGRGGGLASVDGRR